MVQAIIFDFDNTIANTDSLREIRESGRYEHLTPEVLQRVKMYRPVPKLLRDLADAGVKIGLVTNSGRRYVELLLNHLGLAEVFSVVVTYSEVKSEGKKPSPRGLQMALDHLEVLPSWRILYIGDDNNDQLAAYKAHITPVLPTWASPRPISVVPALAMNSQMIIDFINNPAEYKLFAEQCSEKGTAKFKRKGVYFLPLDGDGNVVPMKSKMASICLGRYYSQKGATTALFHDRHELSKIIASKADSNPFVAPDYWIDLLVHVVENAAEFALGNGEIFDVVTIIPGKQGKDRRLERILDRVRQRVEGKPNVPEFLSNVFFFVADAVSQKTLDWRERAMEAERALHINPAVKSHVRGKRVMVIDDVLTSGATLARARALLLSGDAEAVLGVAIAKTVSILEDERSCPVCQRMMRVRLNKTIGSRFWACTGYFDEENKCTHTEALVKKSCPSCGRDMRISLNRRTSEKFWGCSGYNQAPVCNRTLQFDPDEMP